MLRRTGLALGLLSTPVFALRVYESIHPFPSPLHKEHYPLLARLCIHRALLAASIDAKSAHLTEAWSRVVSSGLGAASPQATSLLVYLSEVLLDCEPADTSRMHACFEALAAKPHVGEAVREERARKSAALKVASRLCDEYVARNDRGSSGVMAERALELMSKGPLYVTGAIDNGHLRSKFQRSLL